MKRYNRNLFSGILDSFLPSTESVVESFIFSHRFPSFASVILVILVCKFGALFKYLIIRANLDLQNNMTFVGNKMLPHEVEIQIL